MQIAVLKEKTGNETRVALVPESVKKLVALKVAVTVESGAGLFAGVSDDDYLSTGATIATDRTTLLGNADVLVSVNRPTEDDIHLLKTGAVVFGFLRPLDEPTALQPAVRSGLTVFAVELIPRSTRAQAMDGLSSMATIVGYKAVVMAAERMPRMFPMLMTAAGTVPPARVLVIGAGVAGLQAIATARRLGAVVEGFDIRAAAGEAVRSLGATFLEVDLGGLQTEDSGGYAKEVTEEAMERSRALIAKTARHSDCIITSAQVPGRPAPLLITEEAVAGMKLGSVIVDLAGASGGNCAVTKPGEDVLHKGVTVLAPLNLATTVPVHASQLFSRNATAFLTLLIDKGELRINLEDDVVGPTCVAHAGKALNPRVAAALEGQGN
ncbi:MAG: NAD(P) transhydrogenase subunit alpha [Deltaproteobacteria bacterium]|nr:NAD(P) transhydrogenase subunit alpha [Deltaproteobacteria bacterium]